MFIERAKQDGFLDKAWVDGSVVPAGKEKEKATENSVVDAAKM